MEEVKKWQSLGIDLTLRVSRISSGLYMRIPADIARSLGLTPGTWVQVRLRKKGRARATEGELART